MWASGAECEGGGGVVTHSDRLWSASEEVHDPVAEGVSYSKDVELGDQSGWDDGVESGAEVNKQHSDVCVCSLQMVECGVHCQGDSIVRRSVCPVCKLVWVQGAREAVLYVMEDQPLKTLHHYGCESDGTVVIQAGDVGFLWNGDNGCCFKAGRDDGLRQ